jgi:hypothetical protein
MAFYACVVAAAFGVAPARADVNKGQCIKANAGAQSLRREGKFNDARAQLQVCVDPGCPRMVRDDCTERLDELERAQPTVVFEARDAAGNDLVAVAVTVDGRPLTDHLDGHALPVDPGEHAFDFQVAGERSVHQSLILNEGDKGRRVTVTIGEPTPPLSAGSTAPAASQSPPPVSPSEGSGSTRKTVGLVVGSVGLAAVATGAVFGLLAMSAKNSYEKDCGSNVGQPPGACTMEGVQGHDDASTKATLATVFFVGGGVATAAGAVLFLTAPKSEPSAAVGVGLAGVFVSGRF